MNQQARQRTNRLTIIALVILFSAPVLIAVLMQSQWWDYRPDATKNQGELLEPAILIPGWESAETDAGKPVWSVVLMAPSGCPEDCMEQLGWLRQVRAAEGRHRDQVQLILLSKLPLAAETASEIADISTEIQHLSGTAEPQIYTQIDTAAGQPDAMKSFIIDPAGYIILHYAQGSDANGIKKDLGRLITWTNKTLGENE